MRSKSFGKKLAYVVVLNTKNMALYVQFTSFLYLTVPSAAMPPYGVVLLVISVFK